MSDYKIKFENKDNNFTVYLTGRIDSSNTTEIDQKIFEEIKEPLNANYFIDMNELDYISSAGLRILLKLSKLIGNKLSLVNVGNNVFEILEITGFRSLLNIQKKLREISIDNCTVIGQGATCNVYRIDNDTIVKVYNPAFSIEHIKLELEYAKKAFVAGIPTAISYDIVKCGDSYGVVFELLGSDTLSNAIKNNPERFEEYMDKYVGLFKKIHEIHVEKKEFEDIKNVLKKRLNFVENLITPEEKILCTELIDSMKDSDTLIHGDLHPGNIMIQDDELMLIDMVDLTIGSPLYDEVCLYRDLYNGPILVPEMIERSVGLDVETIKKIYDAFLKRLLGTDDNSAKEKYLKKMELLTAFNTLIILELGGEELVRQIGTYTVENLFRGTVLKNLDTLRKYLSE